MGATWTEITSGLEEGDEVVLADLDEPLAEPRHRLLQRRPGATSSARAGDPRRSSASRPPAP